MSDPYRHLFLDMLELVLKKEPTHETQLELLRLATPGLDESTLNNRSETKKLFRTLLIRVHPDKHPKEIERATRLCQDVKVFYDRCSLASPEPMKKKRRESEPPKSTAFPLTFKARDEWPYIGFAMENNTKAHTSAQVSCLVAYQCINSRGSIAHGKTIGRKYSSDAAIAKAKLNAGAREVFEMCFGGAKELRGAEEIKGEIMKRGPVVSTSFRPNEAFLSDNSALLRPQREFLIVGWMQQPAGEVWIVAPLSACGLASLDVHVSSGQFGIDDRCVAPTNSLDNISWELGPYLDINAGVVDGGWRAKWNSMAFNVTNIEPLLKELGTVSISAPADAPQQEHTICIRDKNKKAHSRRGILRSIKWIDTRWEVDVEFCS